MQDDGTFSVDLGNLPNGEYEIEVEATNPLSWMSRELEEFAREHYPEWVERQYKIHCPNLILKLKPSEPA